MSDSVAAPAQADELPAKGSDPTPIPESVALEVLPSKGPGGGKKKKKSKASNPGAQDRRPAIKLDLGEKPARQKPSDQGRKDGHHSGRRTVRDNTINFLPIASHPAELRTIVLRTEYTQKLFADHYGRAQISLYNLMCYLPIKLRQSRMDADAADEFMDSLEQLVDSRIQTVIRKLNVELARAKKIAADNQVERSKVYSRPAKEVSLAQLTPQIADLLGLLPMYDEYATYMDALWVARFAGRREREVLINGFRNDIVTLIRHLMHLYHESKRLVEKGEAVGFSDMLVAKVNADTLPVELEAHDEAEARALTGVESDFEPGAEPNAESIAA